MLQLLLAGACRHVAVADRPVPRYLDDGTGFRTGRGSDGLAYGWDCAGDTSVSYASGRRGLDRDAGLGMNQTRSLSWMES